MMSKAIQDFYKQLHYEPVLENADALKPHKRFIVCGMGGSHLAGGLIAIWNPHLSIFIHRDYGVPSMPEEELKTSLIIASSYSGNTEEALDAFEEALKQRLPLASVSVGGKLIKLSKERHVPYIQLPDTGIQPRSALGFSIKALLLLLGQKEALSELTDLAPTLNNPRFEKTGKALAQRIQGYVPLIYASRRNEYIAYNWKIKFNETAKIPAFYNVLPELNHNEMTGFDAIPSTKPLSEHFSFIFLPDKSDRPQIIKRMEVLKMLYEARNFPVEELPLEGNSTFEKMFSSLLIADWTAFYTGSAYGTETEEVPMVEEFKKRIAG